MAGSVFQQVQQYLLDQHLVHRHHQHLVGQLHLHREGGLSAEFRHGAFNDLLGNAGLFNKGAGVLSADTCHREKVLHHADEPAGILVGVLQQHLPLLLRQPLLLHQRFRCAYDTRQGGADVVGHSTQEVGVDLLTLRLTPQHLVLLGAGGQHARHNRNGHHHEERQREARQGKTDLPIGEGKDIVHSKDARHSGDDAEKVPFREQRRQKHIHEEDDRHIAGVIVGIERAKEEAQHRRYSKENHCYENIFDEIDRFV